MIYISKTAYESFIISVETAGFVCNTTSSSGSVELNDYCYTRNKECSEVNSKLSDLTFTLDNQVFTVPVDGYLMDDYEGHPCSVFVSYNSDDTTNYILGTTFMRNFVISFNYDDTTMTLTSKWPATDVKTYYGMSGVTVVIVLFGVAALLAYIGVLIFCCCKHKM
jgi:hypothetical protein